MNLKALPSIFEEIAGLLEIKGENPFKIRAYRNAARVLSQIEDLEAIVRAKKLKEIDGIGEAISKKIEEYYEKGKISYYEDLKREIPPSLLELTKIPNLGPKKIKVLYEKLGVTNIGELEYAIKENRLLNLFRFGKKTQDRILSGIEFFKKHKDEFLLADVEEKSEKLKAYLIEKFPEAKIEVCGSVRRKREVVRDIDILFAGEKREDLLKLLSSLPESEGVLKRDFELAELRLFPGIKVEIRFLRKEDFPFALLYYTGSKEHLSSLDGLLKEKGITLSPNRFGPQRTEEEIYGSLGLDFIEPELREGFGEVEAALSKNLPKLIGLKDIKGVFHVHTDFSDGIDSIEDLVNFSKKMGFHYIGISDHSKSAHYAGGLSVEDLKRQWKLIDEINRREDSFYVFKGIECEILPDGSLDYPREILRQFDFVIASIHSHFQLEKKEQMKRLITAIRDPYVTILGHPTGRLLLSRDGYSVDMEEIIEVSAENGVIIELNASPYRLDIDWRYLKYAKEKGCLISINPDAHSKAALADTRYGVSMARKGWLEKKDVLNAKEIDEIRIFFSAKKKVAV